MDSAPLIVAIIAVGLVYFGFAFSLWKFVKLLNEMAKHKPVSE